MRGSSVSFERLDVNKLNWSALEGRHQTLASLMKASLNELIYLQKEKKHKESLTRSVVIFFLPAWQLKT